MAFQLISAGPAEGFAAQSGPSRLPDRAIALVLTAALNAVLIYAAIGWFRAPAPLRRAEPNVLTLTSPVSATPAAAADPLPAPAPPVAAPVKPVEVVPPVPVVPLPPPEWAAARMPPSQLTADPMMIAAGAGSVGSPGGGGGDDDQDYDPYAGASPMRRERVAQVPPQPVTLDRTILQEIHREVRERYPEARGGLSMRLEVSGAGVVTAITTTGSLTSAAGDQLKSLLRQRLRLPKRSQPYTLMLPAFWF